MLSRRGTTLVELLVALVLAAIILASATGTLLRQQRATSGTIAAGEGATQVRAGTALLAAQFAGLAPSATDLREASDTALQARTAVLAGLACATDPVTTIAADDADLSSAGIASAPRPGDSLWWYEPDSLRWAGRPVADAWADSLRCDGAESGGAPAIARRVLRLRLDAPDTVPTLAPLRVTRQVRLALYRSGDGTWQFGFREWSASTGAFAGPQPAAGPFQRVTPDGARSGFRYFDADGAAITPNGDPRSIARIARIRITAIALPPPAAAPRFGPSARDSFDVALRPAPGP